MNNQNDITDIFVQIRRAEWANDYKTCMDMIELFKANKQISAYKKAKYIFEERNQADSFNPQKALLKTINAIEKHLKELNPEKMMLEKVSIGTTNLRGTISRIDEFVFKLKGYLFNLELEDSFYKKVNLIASEYGYRKNPNSPDYIDRKILDSEVKTFAWIRIVDEMRIQTRVGDFALFEMIGTWIGRDATTYGEKDIVNVFQRNLEELEPLNTDNLILQSQ